MQPCTQHNDSFSHTRVFGVIMKVDMEHLNQERSKKGREKLVRICGKVLLNGDNTGVISFLRK